MKKILMSIMAIALVIGLVGAGVTAQFSDTETSTGNTFTAGVLDLTVDGANDPIEAKITVATMAPGDTGNVVVALNNVGSIGGNADLHIKNVVNTEGANPESETNTAEPGDLGAALLVTIQYDANNDGDYDLGETIVSGVTLDSQNSTNHILGALGAGQTRNVKISWSLPDGTGNDVQGDVVTFDVEFSLNQ